VTESDVRPQPPGSLGARGQALWSAVTEKYTLRPDELAILADAAHEADVIELLRAEFGRSSLITTGSRGQEVAAPHVSEIRQHRACLATLLKALKLPDEDATRQQRSAMSRSELARKAVMARWHPTTGSR
jgi:hypothetical protein